MTGRVVVVFGDGMTDTGSSGTDSLWSRTNNELPPAYPYYNGKQADLNTWPEYAVRSRAMFVDVG